MIYEFIATIAAGFGMGGFALIIRHLTKLITRSRREAPKWLIPIFAGIGMLGFQIYQEYHWQEQQMMSRGDNLQIVSEIKGEVWYRPWSYLKPQVLRMMAVGDVQPLPNQNHIKMINLYLLERRVSTKVVPQLIDCHMATIVSDPALVHAVRQTKDAPNSLLSQASWQPLESDDQLFKIVCK